MNSAQNKHAIYLKMSVRGILHSPSFTTLRQLVKYFSAWSRFLDPARNSLVDRQPWISFAAIDFIKKIVSSDMRVFEYGSGGSTLFWAEHVHDVISIEHDESWWRKMADVLGKEEIKNVSYEFIAAEPANDFELKKIDTPEDYISADQNYRNQSFKQYASWIDQYPNESFNIIVIDGRARPSCVAHAIPKLKKNGYLVIDNTERKYYLSAFNFASSDWEIHRFFGPVPYNYSFSETTIIRKK